MQVLFDSAMYAALEAEADSERQSVAAVIREAVSERLDRRRSSKSAALERLFARADQLPDAGPINWTAEKESFERDFLRGIS